MDEELDLDGDVIGTTENAIVQRINAEALDMEQINNLGTFLEGLEALNVQKMFVHYVSKNAGIPLPSIPPNALLQRIIGFVRTYIKKENYVIHWSQELEVQYRNTKPVSETYKRSGWVSNQINADITDVPWIKILDQTELNYDAGDITLVPSENNTWIVNGVDTGIEVVDPNDPPKITVGIDGTISLDGTKVNVNILYPLKIEQGGTGQITRQKAYSAISGDSTHVMTNASSFNAYCAGVYELLPCDYLHTTAPHSYRTNSTGMEYTIAKDGGLLHSYQSKLYGENSATSQIFISNTSNGCVTLSGPQLYFRSKTSAANSWKQWNRAVTDREIFPSYRNTYEMTYTNVANPIITNGILGYGVMSSGRGEKAHYNSYVREFKSALGTIVQINIHEYWGEGRPDKGNPGVVFQPENVENWWFKIGSNHVPSRQIAFNGSIHWYDSSTSATVNYPLELFLHGNLPIKEMVSGSQVSMANYPGWIIAEIRGLKEGLEITNKMSDLHIIASTTYILT